MFTISDDAVLASFLLPQQQKNILCSLENVLILDILLIEIERNSSKPIKCNI